MRNYGLRRQTEGFRRGGGWVSPVMGIKDLKLSICSLKINIILYILILQYLAIAKDSFPLQNYLLWVFQKQGDLHELCREISCIPFGYTFFSSPVQLSKSQCLLIPTLFLVYNQCDQRQHLIFLTAQIMI